MTWVLIFLFLPLSPHSILVGDREADTKQINKMKFCSEYAGVILREMSKISAEDMECDLLDAHYLEKWLTDFMELVSNTHHFENIGSTNPDEAKEYAQAMNAYWIWIKSHCQVGTTPTKEPGL
jgi:hypothetical protein